jgi:hypothetical protein
MGKINRKSSNRRVSQGLLTDDDTWIFLSRSFCKRTLMRANAAKAFIRGNYIKITAANFFHFFFNN